MRKPITFLSLGIIGCVVAVPATLESATLQPPSSLCVQTLVGLDCASEPVNADGVKWHPGHYVMDNVNAVIDQPHFKGMKAAYFWRDLEPVRGQYDFSAIEEDLRELSKHGKRLFIQVGFKAFNAHARDRACAPEYAWDMGGVYAVNYEDIERYRDAGKKGLWKCIAKLAEPKVIERIAALAQALGKRFNSEPYVEGVALPETAGIGGENVDISKYVAGLEYLQREYKAAFPNTVVLQMANWLPRADMKSLMQHAYETKIGVSGPDLMPKRETDSSVHYPAFHGKMPLAMDNQRAEQFGISPAVAWDFAINDPNGLKVNYLFWGTNNSGIWDFGDKVVPLVNSRNGTINMQCPANIRCNNN